VVALYECSVAFGLYSTGISPWNSPRFVVASRFKNPSSSSLEGSCLTFSPFASLSQAAFGSSEPSRESFPFEKDSSPSFASRPPSASLTRKSRKESLSLFDQSQVSSLLA